MLVYKSVGSVGQDGGERGMSAVDHCSQGAVDVPQKSIE